MFDRIDTVSRVSKIFSNMLSLFCGRTGILILVALSID